MTNKHNRFVSTTELLVFVVRSLSRVWLCNPMDCSTPGFPVLHYLPEVAQTHVHWVGNASQPSHPLSPPSPALNLSQHQGRFQWVGPWTVVTIFVLLRLPSAELFSSPHTGTQLDINYWFPPASSWQPQLLLPLCSTNLIWSPCEWNHTASVIFWQVYFS